MRGRALVCLVAIAVTIASGGDPVRAGSAEDAARRAEDSIQAAIEFRLAVGLRADYDYVAGLAKTEPPDAELGLPLTSAEALSVRRRIEIQEQTEAWRVSAGAVPEVAGIYADRSADPAFVVQVTSDDTSVRENVLRRAPAGIKIQFELVANSRKALENRRQAIFDQIINGDLMGHVARLGVNTRGNNLRVVLVPGSSLSEADVKARFGADIEVGWGEPARTSACTDWNNCAVDPWRGGLSIERPVGCSSGFVAKEPDGGSARKMFTAGHCGPVGSVWTHDGTHFGTLNSRCFADGCKADTALINIRDDWAGNKIETGGTSQSITSQQASGADYVGEIVCHSGARHKDWFGLPRCGEITDVGEDVCYDTNDDGTPDTCLQYQRLAAMRNCGGDSGAPIYDGNVAVGTLSGRFGAVVSGTANECQAQTIFSHINWVTIVSGGWRVQTAP